ncbi:MAG: hypothetical protein EAZ53_14695, partial [Bacteroidetes bacterium]
MFTKKSKTAFLFFSFVFTFSFGQLKVKSNGDVRIGTIEYGCKLYVSGYKPSLNTGLVRFLSVGDQYGTHGPILTLEAIDPSNTFGMSGYQGLYGPGLLHIRQGRSLWHDGVNWRGDSRALNVADLFIVQNGGRVDLTGQMYINGGIVLLSDRKIKKNISTYSNALSKILGMRGVGYDALDSIEIEKFENVDDKTVVKKAKIATDSPKNRVGFVAQEMEQIAPELVYTNTISGMKGVNYIGVVPILVEALKELNIQVESLKAEVKKLKNTKAGARTDDTKSSTEKTTSIAFLYQNSPNPFSQETTIKYSLPETVQD